MDQAGTKRLHGTVSFEKEPVGDATEFSIGDAKDRSTAQKTGDRLMELSRKVEWQGPNAPLL